MQDRKFVPNSNQAGPGSASSIPSFLRSGAAAAAACAEEPGRSQPEPLRTRAGRTSFTFDRAYVERLAEGDPQVETHFVEYFSALLFAKLRFHLRSDQEVQDLRQEVFLRVLRAIRQGCGVHQPERFGAYVNAVCNNVLQEHFRHKGRMVQFDETTPEPKDSRSDLEGGLVTEENKSRIRSLLGELRPKDRNILRAIFLEEHDKERVCRDFGVSRTHLRVLLHRAKERFRHLKSVQAGWAGSVGRP